ncbi:MAG: hypothetical protein ACI97K_000001, partial [Glaciecola sp.]
MSLSLAITQDIESLIRIRPVIRRIVGRIVRRIVRRIV